MDGIIKDIFKKHHDYYKNVGVETIKQQMAQYCQVEEAYQGRFIFELLQNAIDRAEKKVYVKLLDSGVLIVANDGQQFTFSPDYNYHEGGSQRGDFQSLCSIATSTKLQSKNIGNKGVGFKSVYSVSHYAEIYCVGRIGNDNAKVNFRLFDVFNEATDLPSPDLISVLEKVKKENPAWGIPGYYFPQLLDSTAPAADELLNNGFVTVISVPISKECLQLTIDKINEFKSFQLHFINTLRNFHDKIIHVNFNDSFERIISPSESMVSKIISDDALRFAKDARLNITNDSKIAIFFRPQNDSKGRIYNFLPTECPSPFPNIDIHADFQTSVDRKNIVLDQSTAIGKYNSQLLLEVYKLIRLVFIGETTMTAGTFSPKHLKVRPVYDPQNIRLFKETFFATYESDGLRILHSHILRASVSDFDRFYNFLFGILSNCRAYGDWYGAYEEKAEKLGETLSTEKFLPDTDCHSRKIFFRSSSSASIKLPRQIDAEITSYFIPGHSRLTAAFKKGCGIKPFEDTNQIYSLYWQCSPDGSIISTESITEQEQIEILCSVAQLTDIERSPEDYSSPTRRFATINEAADVSDKTRAAFALSTLFYRTNQGKYKPGQTLKRSEIAPEFIARLNLSDEQLSRLLNKTGVSRSSSYTYADCRMHKRIADGLDYIPALCMVTPQVRRSEAWDNIRIYLNHKPIKPALTNENYTFFHRILRNDRNKTILNDLRVANYESFPKPYIEHLRKARFTNSLELRKFYAKFAKSLFEKDFILILNSGKIETAKASSTFFVIDNPRLLSENNPPLSYPILLTTTPPTDKVHRLSTTLTINHKESEQCPDFKPEYLANLSAEKLSVKISESDASENIHEKIHALNDFKVIFYNLLVCNCQVESSPILRIDSIPYIIDNNIIHIKINPEDNILNRHLIACAYSDALFSTERYTDAIELILCGAYISENSSTGELLPIDDSPNLPTTPVYSRPQEPDLDLSAYSIIEISSDEGNSPNYYDIPSPTTGDGMRHSEGISPESVRIGLNGEEAISQLVAKRFCTEYPLDSQQNDVVKEINNFLSANNFAPIVFNPNDVATSLWYTCAGTKPFDIVSYSNGKMQLIEVKTTRGNNIIRLSKREMQLAAKFPDNYLIYRLDITNKTIEILRNPIKSLSYNVGRYQIVPSGLELIRH